MNVNPSIRLYEIARAMTDSQATNEKIAEELANSTITEWNRTCESLERFLAEDNVGLDEGFDSLEHIINIAAGDGIDEATLLVAYMEWLCTQKSLMQLHSQLHM